MTSTFTRAVIHPRNMWGADDPTAAKHMKMELDRIFAHWLGKDYPDRMTDKQKLQSAQRFHMGTKKWSDLAYSFAIGDETFVHNGVEFAKMYMGRGFNIAGGHTFTENDDSYGILFLNGEGGQDLTEPQWRSFTELVELIRVNHQGGPLRAEDILVMGHKHDKAFDGAGTSTACPGPTISKRVWEYNHARDYEPVAAAPRPPVPGSPTREEAAELTQLGVDELLYLVRNLYTPEEFERARARYWSELKGRG